MSRFGFWLQTQHSAFYGHGFVITCAEICQHPVPSDGSGPPEMGFFFGMERKDAAEGARELAAELVAWAEMMEAKQ